MLTLATDGGGTGSVGPDWGDTFGKLALIAARAVVKENPRLALRTKESKEDLYLILMRIVWENHVKWNPSISQYQTFAKMVAMNRLKDLAEAANTRKACLMDGRITPPDTPEPEPDLLITDLSSKVKLCQSLDAHLTRLAIDHKQATDYDLITGYLSAVFALQKQRLQLIGEYFPLTVGSRRFAATHMIAIATRED